MEDTGPGDPERQVVLGQGVESRRKDGVPAAGSLVPGAGAHVGDAAIRVGQREHEGNVMWVPSPAWVRSAT